MIRKIQHTGCDYYSGKLSEKINKMGISQKNEMPYEANDKKKETAEKRTKEDIALSSYQKLKSDSEKIRSFIEEEREVVEKRIKEGEEGPKIQIGAKEMTQADWNRLLKKVDDQIDEIHKQIKRQEKILDKKKKDQKVKEKKQIEKQITKKDQKQRMEEKELLRKRAKERLEEKRS